MEEKVIGVNKLKNGKWRVVYRRKTLGYFDTYDEAVNARNQAVTLDENKKTKDDKDKIYFDKCYDMIKSLYGYDENQILTRFTVLRIRGIVNGKFCANNNCLNIAKYSYEILYYTIIFCKNSIVYAIKNNNFKNESHMTNYIFKIIENNLNDIYMRMKYAEQNKKEIDNIDTTVINTSESNYHSKNKNDVNKFNELW